MKVIYIRAPRCVLYVCMRACGMYVCVCVCLARVCMSMYSLPFYIVLRRFSFLFFLTRYTPAKDTVVYGYFLSSPINIHGA